MTEEIPTQQTQTESATALQPRAKNRLVKYILFSLLSLLLLGSIAYVGYWYGTESAKLKTQIQETPTPEPAPSTAGLTTNWKTYRSDKIIIHFDIRQV